MKDKTLFLQILQLFSRHTFSTLVKKHQTEYRSKGFRSWDQFVSMLFGQLGHATSLREISYGLQSFFLKLPALGIFAPKHSTLAYANKHRSWRLYEDLFYVLLEKVTHEAKLKKSNFTFSNKLYSIDSSVIDLCLNLFDWAKSTSTKGAIKLHLRLDHTGYIPNYLVITDGKQSDVKTAWKFPYEAGSITVFDRGYNEYELYYHIEKSAAFFVTRLKKDAHFKVITKLVLSKDSDSDIISDSIIQLTGTGAKEAYRGNLRLIITKDTEGRKVRFLTNNFELSTNIISEIYRERWKIELFFKEIKQNLKIKKFVGTSLNAVLTQVYVALIASLLLKYLKLKATFGWAMSNLTTLIRMNLFTQRNIWEWINKPWGASTA